MDLEIRYATGADEAAFRRLWVGFTAFYGVNIAPEITDFTWKRLMDPACALTIRLAVLDGQSVGFAIHQHHPSTWVMGDDCYLEDLYLAPEARGRGIGRALVEDLTEIARAKGWQRLYWNTDEGNATARKLYDSFTPADGHVRYRIAL